MEWDWWRSELGWKPITNNAEIKKDLSFLLQRQFTISSINPFHSIKQKKNNFLFFHWISFLSEEMEWNEWKDIITVLSYIGWPVLNNKSMKENLFGWNWFIWAVGGLWTAGSAESKEWNKINEINLIEFLRPAAPSELSDWRKQINERIWVDLMEEERRAPLAARRSESINHQFSINSRRWVNWWNWLIYWWAEQGANQPNLFFSICFLGVERKQMEEKWADGEWSP